MNTFSDSYQADTRQQTALMFLLVPTAACLIYFLAASQFSNWGIVTIFLGVLFFLFSFFSIKTGLILMAFSMLFSPEFSIGRVGFRSIIIRAEDILIPLLALAWVARLTIRREFRLFAHSPLNMPIVVLIFLSCFSTIRGAFTGWVSPLPGFFYIFKTVEFFMIFFLVVNYVRTEQEVKVFLFVAVLIVFLIGLYTLKQVPSVEIFSEHRISAPFEGSPEPATMGGYMAFFLLILLGLFLYEQSRAKKWFYLLVGIVTFIPFIYTLNRTSYIALIGGAIFMSLTAKKKWLLATVLGILILSPFVAPQSVKDRIAYTWQDAVNPGREIGVDAASQERVYAYTKMWKTARSSPLIGWGVTSWDNPDSQYARIIHETGFLGLGLWLWIFWRLFRMAQWLFGSLEGSLKGMALGYMAGVLGILLHGFGAITFYIVRIMEPFWFVSGLVVSMYLIKIDEVSQTVVEKEVLNP